jgi:hypothetical protein
MTLTKEALQSLVDEIQKVAKPFAGKVGPLPAGGGGAVPTGGHPYTPGKTAPTGHAGGGMGSAGVVDMQRAIIGLAKDVASQINVDQINSKDPNEQKEAKGRDAFGVFLAKNYMRSTRIPGVQFDPNAQKIKEDEKNPQAATRMSVVMDTMSRIGGPLNAKGGEFAADGKWGFRTNAAVHNVYAFAASLFDFIKDINRFSPRKISPTSYSERDLQQLGNIAQADPNAVSQEEKIKFAPAVAAHVRAIQNMYHEIKNDVLEHPAFMQYIQEDDTFTQGPQQGASLTPEQMKSLQARYPKFEVKIGQGADSASTIVTPADLVSLKALQNKLQQAAPDLKIDYKNVVDQIAQQIAPSRQDPGY